MEGAADAASSGKSGLLTSTGSVQGSEEYRWVVKSTPSAKRLGSSVHEFPAALFAAAGGGGGMIIHREGERHGVDGRLWLTGGGQGGVEAQLWRSLRRTAAATARARTGDRPPRPLPE